MISLYLLEGDDRTIYITNKQLVAVVKRKNVRKTKYPSNALAVRCELSSNDLHRRLDGRMPARAAVLYTVPTGAAHLTRGEIGESSYYFLLSSRRMKYREGFFERC